jgi:hypothetical protein
MYESTMHIRAPIEVYQAMHEAVLEVVAEQGGDDASRLRLRFRDLTAWG